MKKVTLIFTAFVITFILISSISYSQEVQEKVLIKSEDSTSLMFSKIDSSNLNIKEKGVILNHDSLINKDYTQIVNCDQIKKERNKTKATNFCIIGGILIVSGGLMLVGGWIGGWIFPELIFLSNSPYIEYELISILVGVISLKTGIKDLKRN